MPEVETHLIEWQRIKAEITQCQDIDIMSKLSYSLEAVRKWAKQSKQSLETQNEIAEYRLRLNRKQGEWIEANIPEEGGGDHRLNLVSDILTLTKVGINRNDSPKFRVLARLPEARFEELLTQVKSAGEELTTTGFCSLVTRGKPHVAQNTGENEWYTPSEYIEAARQAMGGIDVDPASSDKANELVKAVTYFTEDDDGRQKQWAGNIWLNPPYAQPLVSEFCNLLVSKLKISEVQQACVLVNNATETQFYQNMLEVCNAVCFIKGRVKFIDRQGLGSGAPLQGQTILYFGTEREKFRKCFQKFGEVLYATR